TLYIAMTLSASSTCAEGLDQTLDKASIYLETGKPDSAAVLLYDITDTIESAAHKVRALYYLSEAVGQLRRFDEKKEYLSSAVNLDSSVEFADKARFSYMTMLLASGEYDTCISMAREFISLYSDSQLLPDVLFMSGNAYSETGEYQRAFNIFSDITKNHPDSPAANEAVMKAGICLYNLDLLGGSIINFEKYLVDTPKGANESDAHYYLGLAYERFWRPDLAANAFKNLILKHTSFPDIMDAYFRLGKNLFEVQRYIESENAFLNYLANTDTSDVQHDDARYFLERINFKTGKYYSEIQIAENFINKYPESPRSPALLFDLAKYYRLSNQTLRAADYYWVLLNNDLYSSFADSAAHLLADTYVAAKQRDKATAFLIERAVNNKNTVSGQKMLYKMGSLYESWELFDAAIAWYDSSLSVDVSPVTTVRSLWGIGRCLVKVKRWFDAEKIYERITSEFPENPYVLDIYLALSTLFYNQGRINESIREAENSLQYAQGSRKTEILQFTGKLYEEVDEKHALQLYSLIFNNDGNALEQRSDALLHYADLALRMGDKASAVDAYAKLINESPDSSYVNRAQNKLTAIAAQSDTLKN
ncbi:tetratricopeptide repeat protein, partial [Candidatus Omnitrophota bacterium]